jgi:Holliday junction resolvase-like predicted endonuclease
MSLTVSIEVAVPPDLTSTERGRILERFARRLLETQNYKVTEEVRLTGTEVDLLAVEATTGERVFVECKAYRSTISAEVLYKILGNVSFRGFSAG